MVWINVAPKEDRLVARWQADRNFAGPVLVGASMATLQRNYGLQITPTHFLLKPDGTILFKHAGHKAGDETLLERQVQSALGTAPAPPGSR